VRYFAVTLIGICRLFAQTDPIISVNVRQVLVPVIVTDNKGHAVTGLRRSDFQITEDGVPQEIVAFTRETAASKNAGGRRPIRSESTAKMPDASNQSSAAPATPRRITVICFDASHTLVLEYRASQGERRPIVRQRT
jgi:VWFA-related protein